MTGLLGEAALRMTPGELADDLLSRTIRPPPALTPLLVFFGAVTLLLLATIGYVVLTGIGTFGNNVPVGWAFDITNFVFWIGIGHAGTFISAILLLSEQKWRASINRIAEAMTLVALLQAGIFPILHLGRPWFAYWLIPYPSTMQVWPQFRSALTWDLVAVTTYLTVSVLFFWTGLLPDLAMLRERAPTRVKRRVYGVLSLGFRGSHATWKRYRIVYGLLAGLATPLVVSVHSIVSMDFATGILPGWHSHVFPPYFVAGALLSGFAMVLLLLVPLRALYRLDSVITARHLDLCAKTLLVMSIAVSYSYAIEVVTAFRSDDPFEKHLTIERMTGTLAPLYWATIVCNGLVPQLFWSRRLRQKPWLLFAAALLVQLGMWLERFVLIVSSESHDFLPSSAREFIPSPVDAALLVGTFGCFFFFFFLILRFLPFVPVSELIALRRDTRKEEVDA